MTRIRSGWLRSKTNACSADAPLAIAAKSSFTGGSGTTMWRAVTATSCTIPFGYGEAPICALTSRPAGSMCQTTSLSAKLPMFQRWPLASTLGWAENGTCSKPSFQVTGPCVARSFGSSANAEPPSHSARTRPACSIALVLATLSESGPWIGASLAIGVPKVGNRKRPASRSAASLGVRTRRPTWLTPRSEKVNCCTMPSPSNQWW